MRVLQAPALVYEKGLRIRPFRSLINVGTSVLPTYILSRVNIYPSRTTTSYSSYPEKRTKLLITIIMY